MVGPGNPKSALSASSGNRAEGPRPLVVSELTCEREARGGLSPLSSGRPGLVSDGSGRVCSGRLSLIKGTEMWATVEALQRSALSVLGRPAGMREKRGSSEEPVPAGLNSERSLSKRR